MMKRLISFLAALALLAAPAWIVPAFAQQTAKVVATCGTASYTAGTVNYQTIDTTGANCGTGGGGGSVTQGTTPWVTAPNGATSTDISGTVTLGGTYQTVLASSGTRKGCLIQNPTTATEVLSIKVGTMASPFTVPAGATFSCGGNGIVVTDTITLTGATTSHAFSGISQ